LLYGIQCESHYAWHGALARTCASETFAKCAPPDAGDRFAAVSYYPRWMFLIGDTKWDMELKSFFYKTLIVIGTLTAVYVLYQVRGILLLFFGAVLFASTVRPIALKLSERGIPPLVSILVIYLVFLGALAGVASVLFPALLANAQELLNSQTAILFAIERSIQRLQEMVTGQPVLFPLVRFSELQAQLTEFQTALQEHYQAILFDGVRLTSEALILFVMAFYWFIERDRVEELALKMLPRRHREKFVSIFGEIETTLGAYVRGQSILVITVGIFSFIALSLLGVRSAIVLAVFAALMEAIPLIGPFLGAIPAILIALLDSPEKAIAVTIAFIVIQQIEAQVLVPKVMERQVGLSPLFVLLALTSGNLLGGLLGAVVAIPIAAALKIMLREFIVRPTLEARKFPVTEDGAVLLDESAAETEPVETPETPQSASTIAVAK
jgi:predicted PurR-regulated permease PerM